MSTRTKKSYGERALKKLRGIKKGTGIKLSNAIHTVTISARKPVTIDGFLVSRDKSFVVFRHRKSSASKKMRTTTFPASVVISVSGVVGEASQLLVWRHTPIQTLRGYVKTFPKRGFIILTDIVSEEQITVYMNDSVVVDIHADDDEKSQKLPKRKKRQDADEGEEDEEFESDESEESDDDDEEGDM
jgi:hypothetical protein